LVQCQKAVGPDLNNPYDEGSSSYISSSSITTRNVVEISGNSAFSGGDFANNYGRSITAKGVCWSTNQNPFISNSSCSSDGTGHTGFSSQMTNLTEGQTYYVRAYATNGSNITIYGQQRTFTTLTLPKFNVTISTVTPFSASVSINITQQGSSTITARGVCYATTQNPTTSNQCVSMGSGTGNSNVTLNGLTAATVYYLRAYAINASGTYYSTQLSFTTLSPTPATVTTFNVVGIASNSATAGGSVTSEGNTPVTSRGVCYATTQNPTTSNICYSAGSGLGNFSVNLSGLTPLTTYFVRAFAINSAGTVYGSQVSFTTLSVQVPPTVITSSINNVTANSAQAGGNVTNTGSALTTSRGVCFATTQNPTISNTCVADSSGGTGSFNVPLTGLTPSTNYYVRAYALNTFGIGYGSQVTFTTSTATLPTVSTNVITTRTSIAALAGGNVSASGGAPVTSRGVCYSTSQNPTTSNASCIGTGSGTGPFDVVISGLTPNRTYYVRAFAISSVGTAYGNQVIFTTLPQ